MLTIIACFTAAVSSLFLANNIERQFGGWRWLATMPVALMVGAFLYALLVKVHNANQVKWNARYFQKNLLAWGAAYGAGVFVTSFLIFAINKGPLSPMAISGGDLAEHFLYNFRPAIIEEVGFRFGLVLATLHFFGRIPALVAGSVPFGLLHLSNFATGQEIYWDYILGTSVAGLFLTLVFLNYNLGAAVMVHFIWNVLAQSSAQIFSFSQEELEGGAGTLAVLALCSVWLFVLLRPRPAKFKVLSDGFGSELDGGSRIIE